jgi:hypothetical protein
VGDGTHYHRGDDPIVRPEPELHPRPGHNSRLFPPGASSLLFGHPTRETKKAKREKERKINNNQDPSCDNRVLFQRVPTSSCHRYAHACSWTFPFPVVPKRSRSRNWAVVRFILIVTASSSWRYSLRSSNVHRIHGLENH